MRSPSWQVGPKQRRRTGAFDERFEYAGGEDTELGYRCFKAGVQFILNRRAWGIHYPHPIQTPRRRRAGRRNIERFYQKHPNPDIELYTVSRRYNYNRLLEELRACRRRGLPEYGHRALEGLPRAEGGKSGRTLLVGSALPALIRAVEPACVVAAEAGALRRAQALFPPVDFVWGWGMHLSYPAQWFGRVVLTEFWRVLPPRILLRVLRESRRLGWEVYYLYGRGARPPELRGSCWHAEEVFHKIGRRLGYRTGSVPGRPLLTLYYCTCRPCGFAME